MKKDIFLNNLSNFLEETKESYIKKLSKENIDYKKACDTFYSNIKTVQKKLPKDDISLDNLIFSFFEMSKIENNFLYLQGFKDCKKIRNI